MIEPMEHLEPTTRVEKPWGWELWWTVTDRYVGKVIFVNAGRRLSLQYHNHKDESIYVIEGEMILHLENEEGTLDAIKLGAGEFRRVAVGRRHRFERDGRWGWAGQWGRDARGIGDTPCRAHFGALQDDAVIASSDQCSKLRLCQHRLRPFFAPACGVRGEIVVEEPVLQIRSHQRGTASVRFFDL